MNKSQRTLTFAGRTLTFAALLATGTIFAGAQQTNPATPATTLNLQAPLADSDSAYSSSNVDPMTVAENHMDFVSTLNSMQPPPRYGRRPRYRGGNTNPDGSSKYAFLAGGGLSQPIGNTYHYLTPSYAFQVGAGRNYSKQFAMLLQFDYDHFGFNGRTLATQTYILNNPNVFAGSLTGLDGNSHVWSFTLNPTYTIASGEGLGAYVVGGVGFYHKTANFFVPVSETCFDYYIGYYSCSANQSVDKYTSNAPGVSGGFGLTYKLSRFSNERLYGEVRYVYVFNQQKPGFTLATYNGIAPTSTNLYPANSNRTSYVPVKFGIRF